MLRKMLADPQAADEVVWCEWCCDIDLLSDGFTVQGDGFACDSCWTDHYVSCDNCDEYVSNSLWLEEVRVCQNCEECYSYCDHCEAYYHVDSDEHDHSGNGCCESPALNFVIRNDGSPPLANDTSVTVTLPAGTISQEGIQQICRYLRNQDLYNASYLASELDTRWQTKEGTFTKRLGRTLYKRYKEKLSPEVLSEIGNIASAHSRAGTLTVETTRCLNMSAEAFYHEDSCWWNGYSRSRCALKTNGGFGLRTFDDEGVTGRAWVMPLRRTEVNGLVPTFDTETPDAFVVFNGYGALDGYVPARIMSYMAGMTYRRIGFNCDPMYVNGDVGYLVAPEDLAEVYASEGLSLSVESHSTLYQTENRRELSHVA